MVSRALRVPLNAGAPMAVSPRPRGRKRDMVGLLSDENNPPGDTGCIAKAKGTELNSSRARNLTDTNIRSRS